MVTCASSSASSPHVALVFLLVALLGCGGDREASALLRRTDATRRSVQREGRLEGLEWRRLQAGDAVRTGDLLITDAEARVVVRFPASAMQADRLEEVRRGRTLGFTAEGEAVLMEVTPQLLFPFGGNPALFAPGGVEGRVQSVSGLVLATSSAGHPAWVAAEQPLGLAREATDSTMRAPLPRGSFGFSVTQLGDAKLPALGLGQGPRLQLSAILEGSPAQRAGLRGGDILLRIEGRPVATPEDLARLLGEIPPEGAVRVEALRWPLTLRTSMQRSDD